MSDHPKAAGRVDQVTRARRVAHARLAASCACRTESLTP
jgi:hypothetical protein